MRRAKHLVRRVLCLWGYDSEAAFDTDVEQILREAREVSVKGNIDEFLAVTDIVKRRAVMLGYEDEVIEDLEGLFQDGPDCTTM